MFLKSNGAKGSMKRGVQAILIGWRWWWSRGIIWRRRGIRVCFVWWRWFVWVDRYWVRGCLLLCFYLLKSYFKFSLLNTFLLICHHLIRRWRDRWWWWPMWLLWRLWWCSVRLLNSLYFLIVALLLRQQVDFPCH